MLCTGTKVPLLARKTSFSDLVVLIDARYPSQPETQVSYRHMPPHLPNHGSVAMLAH